MSKHDRIKRSRASAVKPSGWTAGTGNNRRSLIWWGAGALAVVAVAAVVVLAAGQSNKSAPSGARVASGLAPAFSEHNVMTGAPITSAGLRGRNVLLFFSEGVMCEACFEQIQSLEHRSADLQKRGLTLINITTDPAAELQQAVQQYGIRTPMISDESRVMSDAYGATGQGMHPDTDGHTFVLIDAKGKIRWRKDYTTMFVEPNKLFGEVPKIH